MGNEEFQEGDVWDVLSKIKHSDPRVEEPSLIAKRLPTTPKTIPKSVGRYSTSQHTKIRRQSAPVDVPDRSKLYGASWLDADYDGDGNESEERCQVDEFPPHEMVARRIARSQISSFSVCEGAGRTLKGRDITRVRNAVLIKTGFLETKSNY